MNKIYYEIHLTSADAMQISSRFKKRELRSCWELTSNLTFCKTIPPHNSSNIFIQVFKPFCMYYISVLERFLSSIRNTADRCVGSNVTNLWPGDFTITQIPEFYPLCFDWQDILRFLSEIFRNYRYVKPTKAKYCSHFKQRVVRTESESWFFFSSLETSIPPSLNIANFIEAVPGNATVECVGLEIQRARVHFTAGDLGVAFLQLVPVESQNVYLHDTRIYHTLLYNTDRLFFK